MRSNKLRNFLQNPPQIVKSLGKALIPRNLQQKLGKKLTSLNIKYESRPPIDTELKRKLQAEFTPETERLSELLRRDLTHWCKT